MIMEDLEEWAKLNPLPGDVLEFSPGDGSLRCPSHHRSEKDRGQVPGAPRQRHWAQRREGWQRVEFPAEQEVLSSPVCAVHFRGEEEPETPKKRKKKKRKVKKSKDPGAQLLAQAAQQRARGKEAKEQKNKKKKKGQAW